MSDKDVTRRHFDLLFSPGLEAEVGKIAIWTLQDKVSRYFDDIEEATDYCHTECLGKDTYNQIAMVPDGLKPNERASEDQVTALVALHADLDFAGEGKKKRYPKNREMVEAILRETGVTFSELYNTGGGMQSLWVFQYPWILKTAKDRSEAKELARVWNMTLREICQGFNCTIDSTFDLSRLLRVPGTFNHKYGEPRPVEVVELYPEFVYMPDHLEQFCVTPEFCTRQEDTLVQVSDFKLPSEADTLLPKVARDLIKVDAKAAWWWSRKRKDYPDGNSASSYDFSIANEGLYRGWSEQEIVQCMFAWRCKHGENPDKIKRRKYVTDTIGKARVSRKSSETVAEIVATPDEPANVTDAKRDELLSHLSSGFGFKVIRIVQFGAENSTYWIEVESTPGIVKTIGIGTADVMMSKERFLRALFDHGLTITSTSKKWATTEAIMMRWAAEHIPCESATEYATTKTWIQNWLIDTEIETTEEWWSGFESRTPFVHDKKLWIDDSKLRKHLGMRQDVKIDMRDLAQRLHNFGFEQEEIWVPDPFEMMWKCWTIETRVLVKLSMVQRYKIERQDLIDETK
jgi:hypothetical protein